MYSMWLFIVEFLIPLITMIFIIYASWHGMELKTGKIEVRLHSIKRLIKRWR